VINRVLLLKTVHVVSAALLFGTGRGMAFFVFMAYRGRDVRAIAVTTRNVVLADWLFTAPGRSRATCDRLSIDERTRLALRLGVLLLRRRIICACRGVLGACRVDPIEITRTGGPNIFLKAHCPLSLTF